MRLTICVLLFILAPGMTNSWYFVAWALFLIITRAISELERIAKLIEKEKENND